MNLKDKIYPRSKEKQTVYLKNVITDTNIEGGEYTIYNDFVGFVTADHFNVLDIGSTLIRV